jgi:hypothetical protein
MKTVFFKSVLCAALASVALTSCVKDDDFDTPKLADCTQTDWVKTREVSDIAANAVVAMHTRIDPTIPDRIEAYVTSSDIGGNFFKSISFQTLDGTKAFSIPVDVSNTFINFEPGRKVIIDVDSLYTDVKYGGIRIGGLYANSSGGAEVGRMTQADFLKHVKPTCDIVDEDQLVQHVSITDAKTDYYINKLIQVDGVEFENSAINTTYYDVNNDVGGATNWNLMDIEGNTVIFRTSSFANFSAKPVADGSGSVRGVMTKYSSDYQFMARSENDIMLNGARFTTLLNEGFNASLDGWVGFNVTGTEVWTYSSTFGNPGGMAKMSGYAGANHVNEDWLISPVQNLSSIASGATLSFDNAYKFDGDPIKVLISSDYVAGNAPSTATWTELTGATLSSGNYVYANSGPLDISAFTGAGNDHVTIAFKYTSNTSAASTWEVDNVKIIPN